MSTEDCLSQGRTSAVRATAGHSRGCGVTPQAITSTVVQKYGGTSLASVARVRRICERIASSRSHGTAVVVVASAMSHTTDRLIRTGRKVNPDPSARELDMLASTGETVSAAIIALGLSHLGVAAVSMTGWQAGIHTSRHHGRARILAVDTHRIREALSRGLVPVVAGYQGLADGLEVTTLGRGGSDTTAVALAAELEASRCEIYTDVDGIMSADPRVVPDSRLLPAISYQQALELALAGGRVIHPEAVEIGQRCQIPIQVRSSFHGRPGTLIDSLDSSDDTPHDVYAIAHDTVTRISILALSAAEPPHLVRELRGEAIYPDTIICEDSGSGTVQLSFTVADEDVAAVLQLLGSTGLSVAERHIAPPVAVGKLSVIGLGLATSPALAALLSRALSKAGVSVIAFCNRTSRLTFIVEQARLNEGVRMLHEMLGCGRGQRTSHVSMRRHRRSHE